MNEKDVEAGTPTKIPFFRQVFDQAGITPEVRDHHYRGSGTEDDPYVVVWLDQHDPRNPMEYSSVVKWTLTAIVAIATLAVAFASSAYSGGAEEVMREFGCSEIVFTLGISVFVLGFGVGPLLWAPMSELFGRQILYTTTLFGITVFNAAAAGSQNIWTLIILRFFAGSIGSSPLTNAGGVIADMFPAKQRGLALSLFALAPMMGPVIGPIVGGFAGETIGWRWLEGIMAIFTGVLWIVGSLCIPETYPPVLLRQRAAKLSQLTGKVYRTKADILAGPTSFGNVFKTSLSRPWILIIREPIVLLLSIYMAIVYGCLYMFFSAYPIVYQQGRGWSAGIGSLPFLGIAVGLLFAVAFAAWDNKRYSLLSEQHGGYAPPEARLNFCMIASIALPVSLFWFAWTNSPGIHWMASIAAGVPFGFGIVLLFLGIMNYLIDAYTIFAASVLAANTVLRSIAGAAFPLFTAPMYHNLGIHWASSIPAFLALACVPFPFLFYKYGAAIRMKCKYAAESEKFIQTMLQDFESDGEDSGRPDQHKEEHRVIVMSPDANDSKEVVESEKHEEAESRSSTDTEPDDEGRFEAIRIHTNQSGANAKANRSYDMSPFDLDRINTRESFRSVPSRPSRTTSRASSRSRGGR